MCVKPRFWALALSAFWLAGAFGPQAAAEIIFPEDKGGDITQSESWTSGYDSAGSFVTYSAPTDPTKGKKVQKLAYSLGSGTWVNLKSPAFPSTTDILGNSTNALRFSLLGQGPENTLLIELKDSSGNVYMNTNNPLSARTSGWESVTVPLSEFTWAFNVNGNTVPASFGWSQLKQIGFTVKPVASGSGSVSIDEITVVVPVAGGNTTPAEQMIDDCEGVVTGNVGVNALNSAFGGLVAAQISRETTPTPAEGTYCRAIANTVTGSGMWERIYRNDSTSLPLDASAYNYVCFYLQASAAVTGDLTLILKDLASQETQVRVQNYTGGSIPVGSWTLVRIPLSAFSAPNLANLGELSFVTPVNSTIYLDRISFNYVTATAGGDEVLDRMDDNYQDSSWETYHAGATTSSLSTVSGIAGNALNLSYTFPTAFSDQWANVSRQFGLNLKQGGANTIQFDYLGTDAKNTLEFKLMDDNGTVFIQKLVDVTDTSNQWKTLNVDHRNLQYFSGADKTFNFKNVTGIEFAISKSAGGTGTFEFSTLYALRRSDLITDRPTEGLISAFSVDHNPFQPRSGTAAERATFSYQLTSEAKVWMKVYSLDGATVLKLEPGTLPAGTHTLIWDGNDRNGNLVRSGMYIFQFTAEGRDKTEKVRNLIGVVR